MSVREALSDAAKRLSATSPSPARDARALVAFAMDLPADRLSLEPDAPLSQAAQERLETALAERLRHRPIAQIIGTRLFWGRAFEVTSDTLDPRPETETLIELALRRPYHRVLDLGTGTGCIALTLLAEQPKATALATDLSQPALEVEARSASKLGLSARCAFAQGSWWEPVDGRFDLIVSNPPYISASEMGALEPDVLNWEPHMALSPGGDGLAAYRLIAEGLTQHLEETGRALFEFGLRQGPRIADIFKAQGYQTLLHADLDGRLRCIEVTA
ncbi:MAG: peptide chain release factor N(5)-glutamine methyltransferase [Pseudomonadota bacterium]